MMKEPSHLVSVALSVAAFLLATVVRAEAQTKQRTSTKTLALGVVFQGPREPLEEHFRPLVDYAARKLTPTAETKGLVVVAPTAGQMIKLLEEKRVDFYMESPYPTYLINRLGAARLLLRRWNGGIGEYRSVIFTDKESGIARLEDSARQNHRIRRSGIDLRVFPAQALSAQERIFHGRKTESRSQGLG